MKSKCYHTHVENIQHIGGWHDNQHIAILDWRQCIHTDIKYAGRQCTTLYNTAFHSKHMRGTIIPTYNTNILSNQLHKTSTTTKGKRESRRYLNNLKWLTISNALITSSEAKNDWPSQMPW